MIQNADSPGGGGGRGGEMAWGKIQKVFLTLKERFGEKVEKWAFLSYFGGMPYVLPAQTQIGHVHLKVADLERSLAFYRDILGFEVTARYGEEAVFISAGGYHHHIGLNTWYSKGAPPAPVRSAGLFHTAILFPTRKDLAVALKRLLDAGYPLTGASDHGVSEALYLDDPDRNGVELYRDRPREEWKHNHDGTVEMYTRGLDIDDLLAELSR